MKKVIILGGVGGQGILTIAAIIGTAALSENLYLKQSEIHGMSQRGGDVQSNLRISSQPIASDLIPEGNADMIISVEPLEALRYFNMLNVETGWCITSTNPFNNLAKYPPLEDVYAEIEKLPRYIIIDAEKIAKEQGSVKAANIVVLGASSPFLDIKREVIENAIKTVFGKKGEDMVNLNLNAFKAGREFTENKIKD
jgi:indolepyruvate ferredoxin oxidoreductase beta subunit